MILDATPLDNPTPELIRLRATLRPPEWEAFRAWMDLDIKRIDQLEDATEAEGEPSAPVIRALYVFETWGGAPIGQQRRGRFARDIARIRSGVTWVKAALTTVLALSAMGCTTLRTPTQTPDNFPSAALEATYQVVNAVDMAQTVNIARRPDCYRETGFPTAELLGHHPTEGSVEAYWALESVAHLAISGWLDRIVDATDSRGWRIARGVWYAVSIGASTRAVIDNSRIGLKPFGSGAAARCEPLP